MLFLHVFINVITSKIRRSELKIMHCWKTINIEHQYGATRIGIWSVLTFILSFTCFYLFFDAIQKTDLTDRYFILFIMTLFILYPAHKLVHFLTLFDLREHVALIPKLLFRVIPIFQIRLINPIPKNRYLVTLIMPFILLNLLFILFIFAFPQYMHYGTLILGVHCSICLLDFIYIKNLIHTPKNAKIEETPRGYEILTMD